MLPATDLAKKSATAKAKIDAAQKQDQKILEHTKAK